MIGRKVIAVLFSDGYGNRNGGQHLCEILDVIICLTKLSRLTNKITVAETHYLVRTIDPAPEVRSGNFVWSSRLEIITPYDLIEIKS